MNKSRINILIVEDDATQGKALYEAFTRDGYTTHLCGSSASAITQSQRQEFHVLMVDCMLPKMNGVDLVEEILGMVPNKPKVFLFTGIFKDREFTREAMKKTGADMFFLKPLDLPAVLAHVNTIFEKDAAEETPPVLRLYSSQPFEDVDLVKFVEQESTLHAFHFPMLYERIHDTTLSGELTLISATGDISTITFYQGNVSAVKTSDRESYFGSLAVSHGFVSPQEVIEALKDPVAKMLGTKLIESMSLSPHAINVILEEQLALRLSQTIHDDIVTLQWLTRKIPKPEFTLDDSKFELLIDDWLNSKLTDDWIKSTLMSWGDFALEGDYHPHIRGKRTVEEVFSDAAFAEAKDAHLIFQNLIRGAAFIGQRGERSTDFSFLESRLDQMSIDFKTQNAFQILGLSEKAQSREVTKAFEGLTEAFDPAKLPEEAPKALREKSKSVFGMIERAFNTLNDEIERARYSQYLQMRRNQEVLESEPIFRTAILELSSGHYKEAGKKFQTLLDRKLEFRDLRSYRIWAGLKEDRRFIGIRIDQIPPEERHSAPYMMAKGLTYRMKGQYKKAIEVFRTAHVMDPRNPMARHELKSLANEMQKRNAGRGLLSEVTQVIGGLKNRRGA